MLAHCSVSGYCTVEEGGHRGSAAVPITLSGTPHFLKEDPWSHSIRFPEIETRDSDKERKS